MKKHRYIFDLTEGLDGKFQTLKSELECVNSAELFRQMITFMWEKKHPGYVEAKKRQLERISRDPMDKAAEELAIKEAKDTIKEQRIYDHGKKICDLMGGTIDDEGYCHYNLYMEVPGKRVKIIEQKDHVEELKDIMPTLQYTDLLGYKTPTAKEKILELLANQPADAPEPESPFAY